MSEALPNLGGLDASTMSALDPYLYWYLASGFKDFGLRGDDHFDVMIELQTGKLAADLARAIPSVANKINLFYGERVPIPYTTATISKPDLLELMQRLDLVKRIQLAAPLQAPRAPSRRDITPQIANSVTAFADETYTPSGSGTLLAVIDDGCPFAHQMLWHEKAYRLRAIWDQDRQADFAALGEAPPEFGYGAQAGRSALLAHIRRHTVRENVDEEACYRSLGYHPAMRVRSHGGHTLGMYLQGPLGMTPSLEPMHASVTSDMVFVQLPRDVTNVPAHGARLRAMLDGIRWVLNQATPQETTVRVVVPYGSVLGPHDGTGVFTVAVDALVSEADKLGITLQVILPTGNDFNESLHWVAKSLNTGVSAETTLRLAPESELPVFVELWLPQDIGLFSISVFNPSGENILKGLAQNIAATSSSVDRTECTAISTGWTGQDRTLVLLRFSPTLKGAQKRTAQPGDWSIHITSTSDTLKPLHAYVSKARGGLGSLKRAHQSKFVNTVHSSVFGVSSDGTISDAATGKRTIVLGAYKPWDEWEKQTNATGQSFELVSNQAAEYASAGPASGGARLESPMPGPNYSMPSEQSPWLPGFRNAGNRSAATHRMNGTSVAASYFAALEGRKLVVTKYPSLGKELDTETIFFTLADDMERLGAVPVDSVA